MHSHHQPSLLRGLCVKEQTYLQKLDKAQRARDHMYESMTINPVPNGAMTHNNMCVAELRIAQVALTRHQKDGCNCYHRTRTLQPQEYNHAPF
jgi:hypothetical protein